MSHLTPHTSHLTHPHLTNHFAHPHLTPHTHDKPYRTQHTPHMSRLQITHDKSHVKAICHTARRDKAFHPRHKLPVTRHKSPAAAPCAIKGLDAKISWMMKFDALASLLPLPLPPPLLLLLLLLEPRIPKRGNSLPKK